MFMSTLYHRVCCFVLFVVAASASFSGFYQKSHFCEAGVAGSYDEASFESMVDGTAYRPYVYRQLLPAIANRIDRIAPDRFKNWLYIHQGSGSSSYMRAMSVSPTAQNKVYFTRDLTVYLATFLFALLAVYAMYLVCTALEVPRTASVFTPVVVILLVPYPMSLSGFFYDYSELAFFALAVWVALRFDWWWLIPISILGAWNKESFLLFIPSLYPILRQRGSRREALVGVGVLCCLCAVIYYCLRVRFAHNPGATVEIGLFGQVRQFLHPRALLFGTEETYGVRVPRAFSVLPLALLLWTVWRGWKRLPLVMRRHGQIAAAINIPMFLLFGHPGELRALSMLYIVFLMLLAVNLSDWMRGAEAQRAR